MLAAVCGLAGAQVLTGVQAPRAQQQQQRVGEAAAGVLTGRVTDAETGAALAGASVYAVRAEQGAATDSAGAYRLTLPPGPVQLRVARLGYKTRVVDVALPRGKRRLAVALTPHAVELKEVKVVARRSGSSSGSSEARSTQMSAVELPVAALEELPALLGETDVLKALQLFPGVQSGREGQTGLYVRGGGPAQNLVLLDGAPVYNTSHALGFLSAFNADALGRVRLLKGGFPARYGGRLSSVVDLSMRAGRREGYAAEGALGLLTSSLTAEGPLWPGSNATFLVGARRTHLDLLAGPLVNRALPGGQRLKARFYDANAKLRYVAAPAGRDVLSLSLYAGRDRYGARDERLRQRRGQRGSYGADVGWSNRVASLRWERFFSEKFSSKATLFYTRYALDVAVGLEQVLLARSSPETFQARYTSYIEDIGAKLDADWQPPAQEGRHHVRFGARLVRHAFNPGASSLRLERRGAAGETRGEATLDTTLTPSTSRFSTFEGALYAEDDVRLTGRLKVNAGLHASAMRGEKGAVYGSLQPRLSARYLLRRGWSAKASFVMTEQYLHLLSTTNASLPTDLWVPATSRVAPQRAWQAALGTAFAPEEGSFEISLEGYYKAMRDLLAYEPGASFAAPGEDWQSKVRPGRGGAYGAEVFLEKKTGRTTGWLGYTLAWSRRQFDALNGGHAFPYRYDRRHDLALVVKRQLTGRLSASASWVYGTGQAVTLPRARYPSGRPALERSTSAPLREPQLRAYGKRGGYRMPPRHRLDLSLAWRFGGVFLSEAGESTLTVGAYNAYNRRNPFFLFTGRGAEGRYVYKQVSFFPVLPVLSYRFSF